MAKFFSICLGLLWFAVFSQSISQIDVKKKQLEATIFNHYQLDPEKKEAVSGSDLTVNDTGFFIAMIIVHELIHYARGGE